MTGNPASPPPNDLDAEGVVLSAVLLWADETFPKILGIVRPHHFYADANRRIAEAAWALHDEGRGIDSVAVATRLRELGRLEQVGGTPYLAQLTDSIPAVAHVDEHARTVRNCARQRHIAASAQVIAAEARAGESADDLVRRVRELAEETDVTIHEPACLLRVGSLLGNALETAERRRVGEERPVPLLFREHAEILGGGLWPGAHTTIAGTGTGKSTYWFQNALHAAKLGVPVLYVGLELNKLAVALRVIGEEAGTGWSRLYTGRCTDASIQKARETLPSLEGLPFYCDFADANGWPPSRLVQQVEQIRRAHATGPILVVLDFLQLVGEDYDPNCRHRELRERIGRAAYAATFAGNKYGAAVVLISSAARDKYGLLSSAADSAGLVSRKLPGHVEPVRTIMNPDPLIGVGKESGEIEYAAESQSVLIRWPVALESGETAVIMAVPKLRYGARGWFAMSFWTRFSALPVKDTGELPEVPKRGGRAVEVDELTERILETVRRYPDLNSASRLAGATKGTRGKLLARISELVAAGHIELTSAGCRAIF